jgi:hypothetical protein
MCCRFYPMPREHSPASLHSLAAPLALSVAIPKAKGGESQNPGDDKFRTEDEEDVGSAEFAGHFFPINPIALP